MTNPPIVPERGVPLTAETVGLLQPGDWLRGIWDGSVWTLDRLSIGGRLVVRRPYKGTFEEARDEIDAFTFFGRPDADDWIPHDGGENPAPGLMVGVRCRDGSAGTDLSDEWNWSSEYAPIIAWRPHVAAAPACEPEGGDADDKVAAIRKLALDAARIAPGLWGSDIEKGEGEYGIGDETHTGFMVPYMETEHGKRLFDAHSSDVALIEEDYGFDESGAHHSAWDENSRVIFEYLAAVQPANVLAILAALTPKEAPASEGDS